MAVLVPVLNSSLEGIQALQNGEQCYPMKKNFTVTLTNEQVFLRPFTFDNIILFVILCTM